MTNRAFWFMRLWERFSRNDYFHHRLVSIRLSSPGGCRGRRGRFHVWRTASSWAPWRRAYCWRDFEKRWVVSSARPASRPVGQLLTTPHRTPHTCEQDRYGIDGKNLNDGNVDEHAGGDDGKVDVLPDGPVGLEVRGAAGGGCKYFNQQFFIIRYKNFINFHLKSW